MKKILFLSLILIFAFAPNVKAQSNSAFSASDSMGPYHIRIQVKGLKDTICWLGNYFGKQTYFADTSHFDKNGVAVFNATSKPHGVYLFVMPGYKSFEFIFDEPTISLVTDTANYVADMQVLKGNENKIFFKYMKYTNSVGKNATELTKQLKKLRVDSANLKKNKKEIDKLDKQLTKANKQIDDYRLNVIKEHPNTFVAKMFTAMKEPVVPDKIPTLKNGKPDSTFKYSYYKNHYWDGFDFADQRLLYCPVYAHKLINYFKNVLPQIPDSVIPQADSIIKLTKPNYKMYKFTVQKLTNTFERSEVMGMDAAFVHMGEKYYLTHKANWIDSATFKKYKKRITIMAPLLIGKKAFNITLMDTSGHWIPLYTLQAKYTVLIFWDPDCGHCQKEIPIMVKYFEGLSKTNRAQVKVYTVSSQDGKKWKDFIKKGKMHFVNTSVPHKVFKDQALANELVLTGKTNLKSLNYHDTFDVYSTPTIYLLDKDKTIIAKRMDVKTLDKILDRKLGIKKAPKTAKK